MSKLFITVHDRLGDIDPVAWDRCAMGGDEHAPTQDPFTTYRFFNALEQSGSIGGETGWLPHILEVRDQARTFGFVPMFLKLHSQGEYIFDHAWANAYERAGGRYYPKFQIAVPFTPVTGQRFLASPEDRPQVMEAGFSAIAQLCDRNQISSAHATFCTKEEREIGENIGALTRLNTQYHWQNNGYGDFDAFLSALSSRKRKNIRKERQAAAQSGLTISWHTGDDIKPEHWDAIWTFYQDTGARKWGLPYLTRAFFELAHAHLRNDILLMFASDGDRPIAGAMHFIGASTLFGRYWGAVAHVPFMHFELCYYQAIDYAITNGLSQIEAGAQGEHKLARGYMPQETHSIHYIHDQGFHQAIAQYLDQERQAVDREIEILTDYGPFRQVEVDEKD